MPEAKAVRGQIEATIRVGERFRVRLPERDRRVVRSGHLDHGGGEVDALRQSPTRGGGPGEMPGAGADIEKLLALKPTAERVQDRFDRLPCHRREPVVVGAGSGRPAVELEILERRLAHEEPPLALGLLAVHYGLAGQP